jgi:hypothetical protein
LSELKTARLVLERAINAIEEGTKKHGDTQKSFAMIGEIWSIYLRNTWDGRKSVTILPHDVAVMMSILKIVRGIHSHSFDNFVDEAGYAALACMLHPKTTHAGKPDESV